MLRNRKFENKNFLRQYPISFKWRGKKRFFVADFYCHEEKLIIELDGAIHEKQDDYDKTRDYLLSCMGLKIIRIKNDSLIDDPAGIINILKENIKPTPLL